MALRLVHLEDDPIDRELVADALRSDGIVCSVVSAFSRETFEAALAEPPDLILADFSMPGFDGITAQDIAAVRCPEVPFVFVSGSIGEERAVERLRCGATDYVIKGRLDRLPSAVRRAIRETEDRKQRARAEADLQLLNTELQSRVDDRTRQLKAANEALEHAWVEVDRASRAKSDFLSRMSHDLRTPLNAIMGFAQMLQLDTLTADQADSVSQILRGGQHLLDLINEVLDIARIEAGRLSVSPEPTAVTTAVSDAIELIQPLAAARGIDVGSVNLPDVYVLADRQRVNQILLNLLSNAVKYNKDGGTIRVAARRDHPARVAITVTDSGAGIPPQKLALLFTPFERLGAEQSEIEGTGLGLAVSKGLAEAMKGTLTVESVVDQGSTFILELPACDPLEAREREPRKPEDEPAHSTGTVLYVEDNFSNVLLMQRLLARRPGVRLVHTSSGEAAMGLVRACHPDLVLLDSHLPDISGEEVLRRIWEDPETRNLPVAIVSADAAPSRQRRLLASGAMAYLTKPFDVGDLLRLVDRVLAKAPTETRRV